MKLIVAALFAFFAVPVFSTQVEVGLENIDRGDHSEEPFQDLFASGSSRIVGGGIVNPPNAIPFQVGLLVTRDIGNIRRGGAMISNTRSLTCANCVAGSTSTNLRFGSFNYAALDAGEIRHTITPANYRIHPGHTPHTNNIAILIHPHVTYTANIQPVLIATGGNQFVGVLATMSGWGHTLEGENSEPLRAASNFVVTNDACTAVYGSGSVFPETICTSTTVVGGTQGSICTNDHGGPLFMGEGAGRTLIGIANTFSSRGCASGSPALFARITSHAAWIFSHM